MAAAICGMPGSESESRCPLQKERTVFGLFFLFGAVPSAPSPAGGLSASLNVKENPDGFLSHYL
ncbi:MAG: hypothetical protein RRY97_05745, partial [Oscillibacter sp.]